MALTAVASVELLSLRLRKSTLASVASAAGAARRHKRTADESELQPPEYNRTSCSATQTGFSPPSRSKVCVTFIWIPPGTS